MGYGTITTERAGGVLTATIKNGPVNICDWKFLFDLNELLDSCKADSGIKILVFQSANSDFFLAHLDLLPRPESVLPDMHPEYPTLGYFFGVMYKLTNLPIVTIALVEGVARAGACDFVMAFDIRFGASKFRISHIEACVGVYASGGGSMRLLQSVGKARALEYLYSGRDVTAEEAEKYGWINRAFPSSESMREFSTAYINRVQKFPLAALATTKARINSASGSDALEVWEEDFKSFMTLVLKPETQTLVGEIWTLIKDATYCEEEIDLSNALMTIPSYK